MNNHINHAELNSQNISQYVDYLVNWIKLKVKNAKSKGCILGISGGIDSAVVAALCQKAFPKNTLGIIMPIDSMNHEMDDINELAKALNMKFPLVDLSKAFDLLVKSIPDLDNKLAISNIKPRLRMTTLYAYAQQNSYLVVGTSNKDEYHLGYFTKYGDGGADILPICHLLKSEIRLLAKYLNIPESIINKKPSAGLYQGQSDENDFGFSYEELDNFLKNKKENLKFETIDKINKMHKYTTHKRNIPTKPLSVYEYFKSIEK